VASTTKVASFDASETLKVAGVEKVVKIDPTPAPAKFAPLGGVAVIAKNTWAALKGRVRRVEPSGFMKVSALGVEEQRVNVLIDFVDLPAAAHALGDAYRVEVRVVIWREESVLKVPVGTLFRRGEGWAVFRVEENIVRLQPVRLGERNDVEGQILDGLSEGQTLVLHPPDTLKDGTRVRERVQ